MIRTITIQTYNDGWQSTTYPVTEDGRYYICPSYGKIKIPDDMKAKIRS